MDNEAQKDYEAIEVQALNDKSRYMQCPTCECRGTELEIDQHDCPYAFGE